MLELCSLTGSKAFKYFFYYYLIKQQKLLFQAQNVLNY